MLNAGQRARCEGNEAAVYSLWSALMPSPFPGMDPYLEHPEIFPDLHSSLNFCLREALQAQLPPPYYAVLGRRAWIEVPHDERKEEFIGIYARQGSDKRLVTAIEILSITNKTPGEQGRDLYLRKQRELLESQVHLVEIDLLRSGEHTTAVPLPAAVAQTGPFDYHVCKHHFDNLEDYFVYPIQIEEPLPEISFPLLPGHEPVIVDFRLFSTVATMPDHMHTRWTTRRQCLCRLFCLPKPAGLQR
jgi:hypothetical protein